jgi:hypothetical protein
MNLIGLIWPKQNLKKEIKHISEVLKRVYMVFISITHTPSIGVETIY